VLGRALDSSYAPEVRAHVTLLTAARLLANACYRFAPPFLATIARGLDVSLDEIGVALAVAELAGLLSPMTARFVDRLSRRVAMTVGLLGVAAGTLLAAASGGVAMFTIALVSISQSKVAFDLGLGAWISDHVPYDRRSRVVGLTETSWAFGLLLGVSVMGIVTGLVGWRAAYLVAAIAVVAVTAVVAVRLPRDPAADQSIDLATGAPTMHIGLRRAGLRAWLVIAGAMTLMGASQSLFVTFGSWLEDVFEFTPATLAVIVFGLGLGELAASVTSARRTDAWGKEWSAAMGASLMVPAGLGLALWNDHLSLGLVLLAIGICGFEFAIVSALAIGTTIVPTSPARGLALLLAGATVGRSIASIPATRLYDRHGMAWPAVMSAVLAACTVAALLGARRVGDRAVSGH
jgi:DHA1 family inner membrane transport protein